MTPRNSNRRRRSAAIAAAAAIVLSLTHAAPANAGLNAVGEDSNVKRFPTYVEDANGLRLALCDDPADRCVLSELPDTGSPMSYPDNYAVENFYWAAEAALSQNGVSALMILALETSFANDEVRSGEEVMFSRTRLERVTGLAPNTTYTVMHPYGQFPITTDGVGNVRRAEHNPDTGCGPAEAGEADPPCDNGGWKAATDGFLGDSAGAETPAPFLTWDPAFAPAAPAGHIGDFSIPHRVIGSTLLDEAGAPQNYFRIVGPGVDVRTAGFNVQGRIADLAAGNPPTTPNMTSATDTGVSDVDNLTRVAQPEFTGRSTGDSVELLADGQVVATGPVANGQYRLTPAAALAEGDRVMTTRSTGGVSAPVTVTIDRTAPARPGAPAATALSGSTARISWPGVPTAEAYKLFRNNAFAGEIQAPGIGRAANTNVSGLAGRVTGFTLSAVDFAGNESVRSAARMVGVPGRASIRGVTSGSKATKVVTASVRWASPTVSNSAAISAYRVTVIRSNGARSTRVVSSRLRAYTWSGGLARNARYRFQVAPVNRFGIAPASSLSGWAIAR
ncbi:Ig-like domain-containing protein [Pilimelia columellifera]|uniref:Bacterial Ig-like domain-containing protein n=1 Tax=Pilimelia columellifera subsp. columellifera TaxID=706583 RepID=A0ABP6AGX1_9ACTN